MRTFAAFLIVAAATATALALVASTATAPPPAAPKAPAPAAERTHHRALLAQRPFLGVACGRPNSTRCDRAGLAVWTRAGVEALRATVRGRPVALVHAGHRLFVGYLRPAGLRSLGVPPHWEGARRPSIRIQVWAKRSGRELRTTLRVALHAGWG